MTGYLGRSQTDADYGLGDVTIDCDSLVLVDEAELTQRIIDAFEAPGYQPPRLPAVATELLALSNKPDVDFDEIEALLERDATLAGEILSLCKSAAYDRGGQINTLRDALIRIGLSKLGEVVMQAAMSARVFRSSGYKSCMEALQEHCRVVAHLGRVVGHHTAHADDRAFLAGLMHDVGIAGILTVLGDAKRGEKPPDLATLWPAIHNAHPIAGARMTELWELPQDVQMAVSAHHNVCIEGFDHPLAAAVCLAEALAADLGMGFVPPVEPGSNQTIEAALVESIVIDVSNTQTIERAKKALEITETGFAQLQVAAERWAERERGE